MCMFSRPKAPSVQAPIPVPPTTPEAPDEAVQRESMRERRRRASAAGRQSTILAGAQPGGAPATGQAKTLLGS